MAESIALNWLRRWTNLCLILLLLGTYPLWIGGGEFPAVPLIASLARIPLGVDWALLGVLLVSAGVQVWQPCPPAASGPQLEESGSYRWRVLSVWLSWLGIGAALGLVLLNQHRLQPWLYQWLLFSLVFGVQSRKLQLQLLRWLIISVYAYSAIGKIDYEFLHTTGQQFLNALLGLLGLQGGIGNASTRLLVTAFFPFSELAIAIALSYPRTRRWAAYCAVLFHLVLVIVFGAVLHHSWGVILWNLQFALQAVLLFGCVAGESGKATAVAETEGVLPASGGRETQVPKNAWSVRPADGDCELSSGMVWYSRGVRAVIGLALLLPLVERAGLWDHWLSWALYAPHSSRVYVWVAPNAVERLPDELQKLIEFNADETLWVEVPLGKWSLDSLGTPIYPQDRFQLGVARRLAEQVDSEFAIRAILLGTANRINGKRTEKSMQGKTAILAGGDLFRMGSQPREQKSPKGNSHE